MRFETYFFYLSCSDEHEDTSGKSGGITNLSNVLKLLVSSEESGLVSVSVSLDLSEYVVSEVELNSVVELISVNVSANISQHVVWPVSELNSMQVLVVLSDPESVLEGIKAGFRVQGIS